MNYPLPNDWQVENRPPLLVLGALTQDIIEPDPLPQGWESITNYRDLSGDVVTGIGLSPFVAEPKCLTNLMNLAVGYERAFGVEPSVLVAYPEEQ